MKTNQQATTLAEELASMAERSAEQIPAEAQAVMRQAAEQLSRSGLIDRSLKVGDRAPDFQLPDAVGQIVRLRDMLKEGPVVLSFYRGGWCPFCNLELRALQQALPDLEMAGARLAAVSPQTPDNSLTTAEKNSLSFAVLSDEDNRVARQFGLVFQLPESLRHVYEQFGIDVPAHNGNETFELPLPATYVINPSGTISYAFVNADYKRRAEPSDIVAVLKGVNRN